MRKRTVKKKTSRKHINLMNKKSNKNLNMFRDYFSKFILFFFVTILGLEVSVRICKKAGILSDFQNAYIEEGLLRLPKSNVAEKSNPSVVIAGDEMVENLKLNFQNKASLNLAAKGNSLAENNKLVELAENYHAKNVFYFISADDFRIEKTVPIRQLSTNSQSQVFKTKSIAEDWNNLVQQAPKYSAFYHFMKSLSSHPEGETLKRSGMYFVMKDKKFWDRYLDMKEDHVDYGFQVNIEQLKAAQKFCKERKIGFYVFMVPTKEMVYGPFSPSSEKYFSTQHEKLYKNFLSEVSDYDVKIFDLTPYFREKTRENVKAFYSLKEGLNDQGAQLLTEFIEQKVK